MTNAQTQINANISGAQTDIIQLQGFVGDIHTSVLPGIQANISGAQTDIANLQNQVNSHISGSETRFTNLETFMAEFSCTTLSTGQVVCDNLPAGPEGPEGPQGPQGIQGPIGQSGYDTFLTEFSCTTSSTGQQICDNLPAGPEGPEGPEGPTGADGNDGVDGVQIFVATKTIVDRQDAVVLSGTNLHSGTFPVITLGLNVLTVLSIDAIGQEVIAALPSLTAGTYLIHLSNQPTGTSEFDFTIDKDTLPSDVVLDLPFNGNADDVSGNGHNGSVTGPILTADRFGNPNRAFLFDGVNDHIQVPHHDDFNVNLNGFSVSLWMKGPDSLSGQTYSVLDKAHAIGDTNGWVMQAFSGNLTWSHGTESGWSTSLTTPDAPILDDQWHHIVVIWDTNEVRLYVDSVLKASALESRAPNNSPGDLHIGRHHPGSRYFKGSIDDVHIYHKALTPGEIGVLYNSSGEAGTPHYVLGQKVVTTVATWDAANKVVMGAADCPPGKVVVGGGFAQSWGDTGVLDSRPINNGTSWWVRLSNAAPTPGAQIGIYAICVNAN